MSESLELSILGPALVAGLLVLSTHVLLGQEVLRRGIIFIDIAIAQLAGTGMIAAQVLGHGEGWWQLQAAGLGAALCGAAFLTWTEHHWASLQEAIIGVLFVAMASLTILLLAGNPHGGEELQSLLAGQILWVTPDMLMATAAVYTLLLAARAVLADAWRRRLFYVLFTVAVTTSVQLVGIYLVFASLILPALASHRLVGWRKLCVGLATGVGGYTSGLWASAMLDLPAGAAIVIALVGCSVIALLCCWLLAGPTGCSNPGEADSKN